jgi:hypothetical protein
MIRLPHKPNPIRQNASKSTRQARSRKEQRNPVMHFPSFIPHRQIEHYTRKQSAFGDTEEGSCYYEAGEVLGDA